MSRTNQETLIDYLDNKLEGEERIEAEKLISGNPAAAQDLEHLRLSVELVREAAVLDQVTEARNNFVQGAKIVPMQSTNSGGAVVRSMSKNIMRIAVMILLLVGVASIYKYSATTSSSVYTNNFTSYDLETSRGANDDGEIEKAYRAKDWNGVINKVAAKRAATAKAFFLAGMAAMELKNYDNAVVSFNNAMNFNKNNPNPQYQDESEYYLALSYLASSKPDNGMVILDKIKADKEHLFNAKASAISELDLKILALKH
jgi:hypothetical protein